MKLGIIREALYLPSLAVQRNALTAYGCDGLKEEQGADFVADRRIQRLIADLSRGDEVVMIGLGVLTRPQGRPARAIRDVLEAGIVLTLAPSRGPAISFDAAPRILALTQALAEHERGRNAAPAKSVHQGGSRNRLSKYQVEYARRLYAEGESLRAIGLLFQLSPNHVTDIVAPAGPDLDEADARSH